MTSPRRALLPADAAFRIIALAAVTAMLALPSSAAAFNSTGAQSPDHFSAGDQYVETLPSTKGPKSADGKDGKGGKSVRLPRDIERKLLSQGGTETAKLMQIATSTQLGAPDQNLHKTKDGAKRGQSSPAVPSAAIDAVGGGPAGLGFLVIWLMVITAVALGAVGYRRYRNRDSSR
jgi:hypothetical protein